MANKVSTQSQLERALRICTSFPIHRYLMACAEGRWDGMEQAEEHSRLCKIFIAVILDVPLDSVKVTDPIFKEVHSATQELTGYMDKKIGYPLKGRPDYDDLEPKFFDKFYELAETTILDHHGKK